MTKLKEKLTAEQYHITQEKGTERAFAGEYWDFWKQGVYHCRCCGTELFSSEHKFDAGCGWPSFDRTKQKESITEVEDMSFGMRRVEVVCNHCSAHLGHIFSDGPTETGQRYCINSASIKHEES